MEMNETHPITLDFEFSEHLIERDERVAVDFCVRDVAVVGRVKEFHKH